MFSVNSARAAMPNQGCVANEGGFMRAKRNVLTFSQAGKLQAEECRACGAAVRRGAGFCASCGFAQAGITPSLILRSRPGMVRRGLAEIIDRLMPLPFLAYLFPLW